MSRNKKWTKEEELELCKDWYNISKYDDFYLKKYNRSYGAITAKATDLGLTIESKRGKKFYNLKKYTQEIITEYSKNISLTKLSEKYNCSLLLISKILKENNIIIKNGNSFRDVNYFEEGHVFFKDLHCNDYSKGDLAIKYFEELGYTLNQDLLVEKNKVVVIIPKKGQDNYFGFSITINKVKYRIKIHRLVGYFKFNNKIFDKSLVIRHLDGNSLNNSWDNLAIGTYRDNSMDIPVEIRKIQAKKASMIASEVTRKLTKIQVLEIVEKYKQGVRNIDLAKEYNVADCLISGIIKGRTYFDITGIKNTVSKQKLNMKKANEIRHLFSNNTSVKDISKLYGVHEVTIKNIISERLYKLTNQI